jgi:arylsulfatase A-like enzyme
MSFRWSTLVCVALAAISGQLTFAANQPNIVMLLADDLGYGDLGCMGHPYARTPALDRLAKEGTLFKQFYVSGATCCPSRTGLMTGRFPASFQKYPASYGFSGAITITDLLKKAGYATGHFGKWHIGDEQKPGTFGIDSLKILGGNRKDTRGRDAEITDSAISFLKSHKDKPFYLNVWFHTPHNPVRPPSSYVNQFNSLEFDRTDFKNPDQQKHFDTYQKLGGNLKEGMKSYLGDVLQLDTQVDRILKSLDELGLRENTLVVFTSDNGPANCSNADDDYKAKKERLHENMLGSAGQLRERKHSLHDGGIKVPFMIRWPGQVPVGKLNETSVIAGVDWLPTIAFLCGIKTDGNLLDGENVAAIWLGKQGDRKKDLFWKASRPQSPVAMRRDGWKLYLPYRGVAELYDLRSDPSERKNVAAQNPQVWRLLTSFAEQWNSKLPKSYVKADANDD